MLSVPYKVDQAAVAIPNRGALVAFLSTMLAACSGVDAPQEAAGGAADTGGAAAVGGAAGAVASSGGGSDSGGSDSGGTDSGGTANAPVGGGGTGGSGESQGFSFADCSPTQVSLTALDSAPAGVERIEGEFTYWRAVEGRGDKLFVLVEEALYVVEGEATVATEVASGIEGIVGNNAPSGDGPLEITETHAYFATTVGISRVALATGAVEVVYDGLLDGTPIGSNAPDFIAFDAGVIYFIVRELDQLYSVPADGGTAQLLNEGLSAQGMAVHGGFVYVADFESKSVQRLPTMGGAPERFGPVVGAFPDVKGLAVSDTAVYWVDGGTLRSVAFDSPDTLVELGSAEEGNLHVDGDRIYWQDDSVGFSALDGSGCTTVVHGEFPHNANEYGLTDDYVYVIGDGVLVRVPKR